MALRFESEPASVIGRPQVARFVVESGLLTAFLEVGWYWDSRWLGLHKLLHIPTITPASALAAAVLFILFLALVFYGTSGQVTPLRLVRVPTFDFFFKPIRDSSTVLKERKRTASGRETTELGKDLELEIATQQASAKAESVEVQAEAKAGEVHAEGKTGEGHADLPDRLLTSAAYSAAALASRMERRTNTYLILGMGIGLIGLAVWYVSLAQLRANSMVELIEQSMPRITILIFIELLAGFFLRQYRIGVEDFKYFLDLKRKADAERVTYSLLSKLKDDTAMKDFAVAVSAFNADETVKAGDLTRSLIAARDEPNPQFEVVKLFAETFQQVSKSAADAIKKERK